MTKLRDYQKIGVATILQGFTRYRSFYLADDTGIGKTIQGLNVAHKIAKKDDNVLVIAPVFAGEKWKDEVVKHLPLKRSYKIIITSYTELSDPHTLLHFTRIKYVITIIDESHYLKNYDSIRTRAILGAPWDRHRTIDSVSKFLLWLSATPIPNRIGELYPFLYSAKHPIIRGVTQEKFISIWAEEWEFTRAGLRHWGVKNEEKLQLYLKDIMLRRLKRDVIKELPEFNRDLLPLTIPKALEKINADLLRLAKDNPNIFFSDNEELIKTYLSNVPGFERYAEFRKRQGLYKVPVVLDWLKENRYIGRDKIKNQKIVIWTYHTDVAQEYYDKICKLDKGRNVILITGKTKPKERFEITQAANKTEDCVLIASMHSIKESLDLIGFDKAFYTEFDWSFSLFDQTEGRLLRIGQKNFVNYFYFLFSSGIEKYIYEVYKDKEKTIGKILPMQAKETPDKQVSKKRRAS